KPQSVRLAGHDALDAIRQSPHHGHRRGHRNAIRRCRRRGRAAQPRRVSANVYGVLASSPGCPAPRRVACGAARPGRSAGTLETQAPACGCDMTSVSREQGLARLAAAGQTSSRPALQARGLVKRYGALLATDNVSLDVAQGEIHALIGPNGAGKSTLIQLLSGGLAPDAGSLHLHGEDVTTWPMHRRVKAGLARSFQITSIFPRLSVEENLLLAIQANATERFGMWRPRSRNLELLGQAHQLADGCQLPRSQWGVAAGTLPHAQQRKLEFALAI